MRILTLILAAWLVAPAAVPAGAFHGETCSAEGATPMVEVPASPGLPYVGSLGPVFAFGGVLARDAGVPQVGLVHKWSLTLDYFEHYLFLAAAPDVNLAVCRVGDYYGRHACRTDHTATDICLGWYPTDIWGSAIGGSGDYVVYVFACGDTACGQPVDVPAVAYVGVVF
jgi:hypothetical protein